MKVASNIDASGLVWRNLRPDTPGASCDRRGGSRRVRAESGAFCASGAAAAEARWTPTAFADRVAMARLACAVDTRFAVSEVDARARTARQLHGRHGGCASRADARGKALRAGGRRQLPRSASLAPGGEIAADGRMDCRKQTRVRAARIPGISRRRVQDGRAWQRHPEQRPRGRLHHPAAQKLRDVQIRSVLRWTAKSGWCSTSPGHICRELVDLEGGNTLQAVPSPTDRWGFILEYCAWLHLPKLTQPPAPSAC